jgi:hypothetical protein
VWRSKRAAYHRDGWVDAIGRLALMKLAKLHEKKKINDLLGGSFY